MQFLAKRDHDHGAVWPPLPAGSIGPRVPAHVRDHDAALACSLVTEAAQLVPSCQRATNCLCGELLSSGCGSLAAQGRCARVLHTLCFTDRVTMSLRCLQLTAPVRRVERAADTDEGHVMCFVLETVLACEHKRSRERRSIAAIAVCGQRGFLASCRLLFACQLRIHVGTASRDCEGRNARACKSDFNGGPLGNGCHPGQGPHHSLPWTKLEIMSGTK